MKLVAVLVALFLLVCPHQAEAFTWSSTVKSFRVWNVVKQNVAFSQFSTFAVPANSSFNTFTPLHTYFMAASGCNDANAGTSAGAPWCTPNHAVVCGDVIISAAGTYTNDFSTWGTVSTCPSTSAGIDGAGGIYQAILLCGASDLEGCVVNCNSGSTPCNGTPGFGPQAAMTITKSNWAVEGFSLTCGTIIFCEAMQASASGSGCTGTTQYQAFINNKTFNNGQAFDTQSCNTANGPDYVGVVGNIGQNSVKINFTNNGICIGAFDIIAPGVSDSDTTHTHFFVYNNYSFDNLVTGCDAHFDGEDFLVDSIDNNGVKGIVVHANNVGFFAERNCINYTWNGNNSTLHPTMRFYNNTCYDDNQRDSANPGGTNAEILSCCTNYPWNFQIWNNIVYQPHTHNGTTGTENLYAIQLQAVTAGQTLALGTQVVTGGANIIQGTPSPAQDITGADTTGNISSNPSFANAADLITNHLGVPSCTGFTTTTACLGWNWSTQTATALTVIGDLLAGCGSCSGVGFQPPTQTCTSIANQATMVGQLVTDFPVWLKGIVKLRWTGTGVVQEFDLANRPCGL